jgi:hypothetical protein
MKPIKITKEQLLTMERKARREAELEVGRINYKRVHKSKKTYNRQKAKKDWGE